MALWGNRDSKAASGTIEIFTEGPSDSAVMVGTGTSFLNQAKIGNTVYADGKQFVITRIDDNTTALVQSSKNGEAVANVIAGTSYALSEKPVYVAKAESAGSTLGVHGDITKVYGVDAGEAEVTGKTHAGWVRRTVGTGGRAGRVFYETLVASGTTAATAGDQADDIEFKDS